MEDLFKDWVYYHTEEKLILLQFSPRCGTKANKSKTNFRWKSTTTLVSPLWVSTLIQILDLKTFTLSAPKPSNKCFLKIFFVKKHDGMRFFCKLSRTAKGLGVCPLCKLTSYPVVVPRMLWKIWDAWIRYKGWDFTHSNSSCQSAITVLISSPIPALQGTKNRAKQCLYTQWFHYRKESLSLGSPNLF